MKKFYEQPVVEITAFDVEDIMTASSVAVNSPEIAAEVAAALENNLADGAKNVQVLAGKSYASGSYNW